MDIANIIRQITISVLPLLIAIILHEVSHGFVAYKLGDDTAKVMGRLTLNPIAHIDIFGTIIMPFMLIMMHSPFVFGYAKPVPIDPRNFTNPKRDMAISAAAGPLTNLSIAVISLLLLKYALFPAAANASQDVALRILEPINEMLQFSITINVILASFNLIPVPPLDGGRVLMGLLSHKHAYTLGKIEPYGMIVVLILIMTGIANYIVLPLKLLFVTLLSLL